MHAKVFDYRLLRLIMGTIAFCLPLVVDAFSSTELASISASYHTEARDLFVGLLFVVGALLLGYRGHSTRENRISNIAALAAIGVALFPTARLPGTGGLMADIHYVCAIVLFSILAWFCLGPFRLNTKGKGGKRGRRARVYMASGCVIIGSIAGLAIAKLLFNAETLRAWEVTYWAELLALWAFGVAWITAGKVLPFLVSEEEALNPFGGHRAQASS